MIEAHQIKKIHSVWIVAGIFALAFLIRFYGIEQPTAATGDEPMQVASAINYTESGYFGPDNWYHPPLKNILLYGSIRLIGDNPYGWRMRNALFGAATVMMLYALGRLLFPSQLISLTCAALLMFDPLHIRFSRTTFEDVPAAFFLVCGVYFALSALRSRRDRDWILSGVSFGLAIALRWYSANVLAVTLLLIGYRLVKEEGVPGLLRPASYLAVLPIPVYLLAYTPWFMRGNTLLEWFSLQTDALREMRTLTAASFDPTSIVTEFGTASGWFLRLVAVVLKYESGDGWGTFTVFMNNPPVWIFVIPATVYALYAGIRNRRDPLLLIPLSFCALYVPLLFLNRPLFLYTSIPLLPFGFLSIGAALERLPKKWTAFFLIAATLWSLFLYPLAVGLGIPLGLYGPFLAHMKIFGAP